MPQALRLVAAAMISEMGQTRKSELATGKSALPPRTDVVSRACLVRKVPATDNRAAVRYFVAVYL